MSDPSFDDDIDMLLLDEQWRFEYEQFLDFIDQVNNELEMAKESDNAE